MASKVLVIGGIGPPARPALGEAAEQHFLAAAPARDDADADFHQAGIGLGMGLHRVRVQEDLAAAAEGHAGGRGDDGKRRELQGFVGILPLADHPPDDEPEAQAWRRSCRSPILAPTEKLLASL